MSGVKELIYEVFLDLGLIEVIAELIVNLIMVVIWIIIGVVATKVTKFVIFKVMNSKAGNNRAVTVSKLVSSIVKYVVWFVVFIIVMGELNISIAPFLASAGILGIVIGFGAQEMVSDFFSGFFIIFEDIFEIGEVIEVAGFKGTVIDITLRTTRMENYKGEVKTVNNGDVKNVVNFSKNNSLAIIDFGVAYDTDLLNLRVKLAEFLPSLKEKYEDIIEVPELLGVMSLDDSCISMRVIATSKNFKHFGVERNIRAEIVGFFNDNNIEIPFPQVVVHNA